MGAIHFAAANGHTKAVQWLLENSLGKAQIEKGNKDGSTPLFVLIWLLCSSISAHLMNHSV
jgi:hypothetical protein